MQEEDKKVLELFGKHLKTIRGKRYSSLNNFALNHSVLSSATVSRIENALVDFKFTTLVKLASALNISLNELFKDFNLDYNDFEKLYGKDKIKDAVLYAKDLKDRYTVLWLSYKYFEI